MLTAAILVQNPVQISPELINSLAFCTHILIIVDMPRLPAGLSDYGGQVTWMAHRLSGDFSAQRNFALQKARDRWVLFVDTDETVSKQLADQIKSAVSRFDKSGYYLYRQDIVWDRSLRFGDTGNFKILRLGQKSSGRWIGKVHENWQITGATGVLPSPLIHRPFTDLAEFLQKLNYYSGIRAKELASRHITADLIQITFYPLAKFVYLWIIRLGFMDGVPGLIHAMSMAFYSFLVRSKLYTRKFNS